MVIVGDLHVKKKEPFFSALKTFFDWLDEMFPDEELVLLGDVTDSSSPDWETFSLLSTFLKQRKKTTHIVGGNHTYSRRKGSLLEGLQHIKNVRVYLDITEIEIDEKQCIALPFKYVDKNIYLEEMNNYKSEYDYIFTHLSPTKTQFADEGFDFPFKGVYFHGHIHHLDDFVDNGNRHIINGVPIPSRHGEQNQEHRIFKVSDKIEEIKVPQYFTYETLEYGEMPTNKNNILNIVDAPSIPSVLEKYKEYYVREDGIKCVLSESEQLDTFDFEENSIESYYMKFVEETKVPKEIVNMNIEYLNRQ